ncbi:unnamed protein product [Effrenium voratum]|uniref:Uncharacterized protein n=1 Tax=Effrenium voratum TaxID=2562239 RepID=A0AA36JIS8_9DINO|nr:unnamed protein product [Effrenium voratum]
MSTGVQRQAFGGERRVRLVSDDPYGPAQRCACPCFGEAESLVPRLNDKPQEENEKARVEALLAPLVYGDSPLHHMAANDWIFIQGTNRGGLSVADSLGDRLLKDHGVCSSVVVLAAVDLCLIMAGHVAVSDSNCAVKKVAKHIPAGHRGAWREEEL